MIKTNRKDPTRKDTVSYYLNSETANEFEKYLQTNGILSYAVVDEKDIVIIIEKKYADKADEFFALSH